MKTIQQHNQEVEKISGQLKQFSKSYQNKKLRCYHGSTNSTRIQNSKDYVFIDISILNSVIEVNAKEKFVIVEPNVPMDKLVAETLRYGLIPPVIMEFPGITVGGGINGASLESSSFKYGQLSDNCIEYEIILGDGKIITLSAKHNSNLFYGISGSYGSLGLLSLIKVNLIPSSPFVKNTFYPLSSYKETLNFIEKQILII